MRPPFSAAAFSRRPLNLIPTPIRPPIPTRRAAARCRAPHLLGRAPRRALPWARARRPVVRTNQPVHLAAVVRRWPPVRNGARPIAAHQASRAAAALRGKVQPRAAVRADALIDQRKRAARHGGPLCFTTVARHRLRSAAVYMLGWSQKPDAITPCTGCGGVMTIANVEPLPIEIKLCNTPSFALMRSGVDVYIPQGSIVVQRYRDELPCGELKSPVGERAAVQG